MNIALCVAEEEKQAPAHFTSHQTDLENHEKPQTLFSRGHAEYQSSQAKRSN
ncbi:uncharacterized protein DAT39_005057 [Clarias magur]|uniref:Uncharacterized protein n=1 Tax=Clarias magur TaxID=1594786 RepID=A0A8J4URH3_CLAMG|nr:uncharacterized protein DAT39_005057 [Clarias magur]